MKKSHSRHRRSSSGKLLRAIRHSAVASNPTRALAIALLCLILSWVVLTKSLPYALATADPDIALALNPNNPEALVAKAEQVRARLLSLLSPERDKPTSDQPAAPAAKSIAALPKATSGANEAQPGGERETLRNEIRELSTQAITNDPLNARAYRLLAEVTNEPDHARSLMQEAVKRSRRESVAVFWLLHDSFYRKDYKAATEYAGILMNTKPTLWDYVLGYLDAVLPDPEARAQVVQLLAKDPPWRPYFFETLRLKEVDPVLAVLAELKNTPKPATAPELAPYLSKLIDRNHADIAYNVWLQTLPKTELETLDVLTHPGFENADGSPFDWRVEPGSNATAEFVSAGEGTSDRLFHVRFGDGRVQLPELWQVLLLKPGHYKLEGKLRGWINAKRGLRWQLRCGLDSNNILGETDMLMGESQEWRIFTLEADITEADKCRSQMLRLFHDSRSASEELISGEVWFAGLRLERTSDKHALSQ